jgi:hypothetical protein
MLCEGVLELRSNNTSYCLIEVVTKAGEGYRLLGGNLKFIDQLFFLPNCSVVLYQRY